jgi:hypothetical protein
MTTRFLILLCTRCIDNLTDDDDSPYTMWRPDDPRLRENPAHFMCSHCTNVLTVIPNKIPSGGYSKAAEESSPDRSVIAFYLEGSHYTLWKLPYRLRDERRKVVPVDPPAILPDLHSKETKLQQLRDWATPRRAELAKDTSTEGKKRLAEFDRMTERKRIDILTGEDE